jgi:hypothetical protein
MEYTNIVESIEYFKRALTNPKIHPELRTGDIIMREKISQSKDIPSGDPNIAVGVRPRILTRIL